LWRRELREVIQLAALQRMLTKAPSDPEAIALLECGPVHVLGRVLSRRDRVADIDAFSAWLNGEVLAWASTLGAVAYLDAEPATLVRRLRRREHDESLTPAREGPLMTFLARQRCYQHRLLDQLRACGGPAVIAIDTTALTAGEAAARVRAALALDGEIDG
jgi:hypothetical protein